MFVRRRLVPLVPLVLVVFVACAPPAPKHAARPAASLPEAFAAAMRAEAQSPLAAGGYLDTIDQAVASWNDPWSAAVVAAALDQLVWRRIAELPEGVDDAVAYRSRAGFAWVTARLRAARARAAGHPILGPMIAYALEALALRVGAEPEAIRLRRQSGCIEQAAVAGPLGWPALGSLDAEIGIPDKGAMPSELPGVGPFTRQAEIDKSYADDCLLDFDATGSSGGLRALVVDVLNPRPQWVYLTVGARPAVRVDLGGRTLVRRDKDLGDSTAFFFARAKLPAGRARLIVRAAMQDDDDRVMLQLAGQDGAVLHTVAPLAGEIADAGASDAAAIDVIPAPKSFSELLTASAAALALGQDHRGARLLDAPGALPPHAPYWAELLHMRARREARELPAAELDNRLRSAAEDAAANCKKTSDSCWEARLARAQAALDQKGGESGVVAALEKLGVAAKGPVPALTAPELAYVAAIASRGGMVDLARRAFDALSAAAAGAAMTADIDAELYHRAGADLVKAACQGGTSRSGTRCLFALVDRGDLPAALAELERLRLLNGSPALYRKLELGELVAYGRLGRAALLYNALPPAERDGAALGLLPSAEAKSLMQRDMLRMGDAPFGYEPLARLIGVSPDPAPELEKESAALVAEDRRHAFLPGAGTAVLLHREKYEVSERGLLHYTFYDLRRVSGTEDVAEGAEAEGPRVLGKWTSRTLRRRIYKQDGRIIDPDPTAKGSQGHADLSQLEKGDYVEQIDVGWALPEEHGQLVVDGPDLMPARTSAREAVIELRRPASVPMKVWAHKLLGAGASSEAGGFVETRWSLANQPPRRLEQDVPELETRVAISFGTDSWARIGRAIAERMRIVADTDPYVARWVHGVLGPDQGKLDLLARARRLTAAIGKVVRQGDPAALGDGIAAGPAQPADTARQIILRGNGSRTWALYRALSEAGLAPEIAVAETQPFSAAPGFPPHVGRFVHPLLRLPAPGSPPIWIDADVDGPPLPPGHVSPELRGRSALLPDGRIIAVDASSDQDADAIQIRLELDDQGDATGTFRATIHGRPAQRIARAFETLVGQQRTDLLRAIVLGWLPWADASDIKLSSDEGSWQIELSANIEGVGFAAQDDKTGASWTIGGLPPFHQVLPRPTASSLAAHYTAEADRDSAMAIDPPLFYTVERVIELPRGAKILRLAPGFQLDTGEIRGRREVRSEHAGAVIAERFDVNLPVRVVMPAEFDAFARRVRQVDDGFLFGTRVLLTPHKRRQ